MIHYIIETIAFQLFFLLIYDLFLKKETFFNWNRAYLLVTSMLSFVLPFIKIDRFSSVIPDKYIINLPQVVIGKLSSKKIDTVDLGDITVNSLNIWTWKMLLYSGMVIASVILLYKIGKLVVIIHKNTKCWKDNILIVNLLNSTNAFSFFHYIFIGEKIAPQDRVSILKHEQIHVEQKHTLDLLYFEVLRILFWFNPLVYMCQNRIAELHEFITDAKAVKLQGKNDYYENLLSQVFETQNLSFINPFFKKSLIKKRIIMLSKQKSREILKLKYILLIPLVLAMLVYTSCSQETVSNKTNESTILEEVEALRAKIENRETITEEEKQELFLLVKEIYNKDNSITQKEEREYIDYANAKEVPFAAIDEAPIFPGCEGLPLAEQKNCMSKEISKHVQKKFNVKLASDLGLVGKQRINVIFKIDENGNTVGIRARAPHPSLEKESIRIISELPQMKPGMHSGKVVNVPYSLPIIFQIQE